MFCNFSLNEFGAKKKGSQRNRYHQQRPFSKTDLFENISHEIIKVEAKYLEKFVGNFGYINTKSELFPKTWEIKNGR